MHYRILAKLLGLILGIVAAAMGICFLVACGEAIGGRELHDVGAMGISLLVTLIAAGLLFWAGWKGNAQDVLRKEALAVVSLGWILAALFGSLPFALCGQGMTWGQSFFEAMSGFTTTGSTVIKDLSVFSDTILLWRSLTQWIGGLGILALVVALLTSVGASSRSLMGQESSMNISQAPVSRVQDLTIRLWAVYCLLTVVCCLGLWVLGLVQPGVDMSLFEAILYSLTAVSTGGFAPHNESVLHFNNVPIEVWFCIFMFVGSLNFILILNLAARQFKKRVGQTEAIAFLAVVLIGIAAITIDLWGTGFATGWAGLRAAFFPVVSLSSSTGYGNGDYDAWPLFSRVVLAILMVIGGCSGSTAGGIKIVRVIVALRTLAQEITKAFRPNQVFRVKLDGASVDRSLQASVMSYLVFVAILVMLSTLFVALLEPGILQLNTALGAVLATFFNMGPGFGLVGPTDTFAHLNHATLIFLSFLMLLGRLEIYALVALFSKYLWRKY